jgi:dTDP-4-amino-4,6-dideoxygalactose transaminase
MLIEDAAHALGASVDGSAVGTIGHAAAFSFFANKNLALGEGGMAVSGDPELASRMRLLRSHGLSANTWARHAGEKLEYEVLEPGFNFRMDEARAALGSMLLGRLARDNGRRAELAAVYLDALQSADGVEAAIREMPGTSGGRVESAWHIFPVLLDPRIERTRFRKLLADAGVQTSVHYPPLHETRAYGSGRSAALAVTESYGHRTVTIPLFPHLSEAQQGRVLDAVQDAVRRFP